MIWGVLYDISDFKLVMKLKKFLLRYYPPGILLEYVRNNGEVETKSIDLLNLSSEYYNP